MRTAYLKALSLAMLLAILFSIVPTIQAQSSIQDKTVSFLVQNRPGADTYRLNITIPHSLYQYYNQKSHFVFSPRDFSKFITPYPFQPVADQLRQITNSTEDFVNAVLALVHQIDYVQVEPSKYPIETLMEGQGDCDLFVYIAASILEAGGVPVVLLFYRDLKHMELGVGLDKAPVDARGDIYSVTYEVKKYYVAETTGSSWRYGWRVGECPPTYQNATSEVIAPTTMEQTSLGQVSAVIQQLDPSTLTLQLSASVLLQNSYVTISGQILPAQAGENVTLKARNNNGEWFVVDQAQTDADGQFSYSWFIQTEGLMEVQAVWEGNDYLNGSASAVVGVSVVSAYLVLIVVTWAALCVFLVFVFKLIRRRRSATSPISAPETHI
ncbi:MAG: hypothetical protein ACM3UY_01655 [Methanocella sp.]|jgi:hypothetical protein